MGSFIRSNGLNLHILDYPGSEPTFLFLPGLTANAHSVAGLIAAGLSPRWHTIAVDFRGRGQSEKPAVGYRLTDYTADVIGVMDALGVATAVIVGHSFGALIGMILAAQHRERISHLIILDSSHLLLNERTIQLIKSSLDRLGKQLPSLASYLTAMKQIPYLNGFWDDALESFFRNDVQQNEDGSVQSATAPHIIAETIDYELIEPWADHIAAVKQPVLLINAPGAYGPPGAPPILTEAMARETATLFENGRYQQVPGNHVTMLFGQNAAHVVQSIHDFLNEIE